MTIEPLASKTRPSGLIVKFDGADGAGKTTLVRSLAGRFGSRLHVATSREFGSEHDRAAALTPSATLRALALTPATDFDLWERQLAMLIAARRHNRIVLPALAREADLILVDRSPLTFAAYASNLGEPFMELLSLVLQPIVSPAIQILLDGEAELLWSRRIRRGDAVDKLGPDQHSRAVLAYRNEAESGRWGLWHYLNAGASEGDVLDAAERLLMLALGNKSPGFHGD